MTNSEQTPNPPKNNKRIEIHDVWFIYLIVGFVFVIIGAKNLIFLPIGITFVILGIVFWVYKRNSLPQKDRDTDS